MPTPTILFHAYNSETLEEAKVAQKILPCTFTRIGCEDRLVIARYGVLPYYQSLEHDLELQNSRLINSYRQHRYIADFEYYEDLKDLTPRTYFDLRDLPDKGGPYVVKGVTNSKKSLWNTTMYAPTKSDAIRIALDLHVDMWLADQAVIVREFVPLDVVEVGVTGTPFANEWRFFLYGEKILSYGWYWSCTDKRREIEPEAFELVKEVAKRVSGKSNFYVIDVAKTAKGDWIVIELNDGQLSGLSENDPAVLYGNLAKEL